MRKIIMTILAILLTGCGSNTPLATPISASPTPTVIPTVTPLPSPTAIPSPIPDTLYVNPSQSLGAISPLIFGSNYGPVFAVTFDMLPKAYDAGITILRFPAGSWGDQNDVTELQIDQFMAFTKKMGATAIFTTRLLGGTPEQAAEMVRYTNIEKKYNVQYWAIGNEPTLYDSVVKKYGETYDTARFNKEWREFALAMKQVDPTIKLVGPEINQLSYDSSGVTTNYGKRDETWFVDFLKANGDLVDIVSFHRYPFPRSSASGPASIAELRANAAEWDNIFIYARNTIQKETGRDLPIAVTEFNSDYSKVVGGEATPDSHFNAIWMADVLGSMIKSGVFMANEWALTAKGGQGGLGIIGSSDVYPTYYTYQLYKKFGNELIYSSSDASEVSIYAARRKDGALTILIVNLSTEEQVKALRIEGQAQTKAEAWVFDEVHKAEKVGTMELSNTVTLSPQSVTLYILQP